MTPLRDSESQSSPETEVRAWIESAVGSQPTRLSELMTNLQRELRQIAHSRRQGSAAGDTLSTTALVNEAYIKLSASSDTFSQIERDHFLAIAARAMRYILINHARDKIAQKRGSDAPHESLGDDAQIANDVVEANRMLELDDALLRLERIRPRLAQVVQLRYFAGLSEAEVGQILDLDPSSVRRDWVKARGWLSQQLAPE